MTVCVTAYSDGVQADLQDNLIRLHIIADSDDDNDQAVKLKVRDAILKNVGDRLSKTDKNECRDEIINDLNKSMVLPAGEYYGVRIVLGSGEGHNWWCVMYPPLCFKEGEEVRLSKESEKILREKLDKDTYDIITKNDKEVVVKFKLVEIVQEIKQKINGD